MSRMGPCFAGVKYRVVRAPSHTLLYVMQMAKAEFAEKARSAGVPAITTAGIYPGTSNVMAAHMISIARKVRLDFGE